MAAGTMSVQDARALLNVPWDFSKADLSTAYRRFVRLVHPDRLVGASPEEQRDASNKLTWANLAQEVLEQELRTRPTPSSTSTAPPPPRSQHSTPTAPKAEPAWQRESPPHRSTQTVPPTPRYRDDRRQQAVPPKKWVDDSPRVPRAQAVLIIAGAVLAPVVLVWFSATFS